MNIHPTNLPEVLLLEPAVFGDERGYFLETYQAERYAQAGIPAAFVQDNLSYSRRGILRGLHLQHPHDQGKLVCVLEGEVFDVAVDVRLGSPTFGRWVGATLAGRGKQQLWIPPGFAHGFCVLSETALFSYKCTEKYHPEDEIGIRWDDPGIAIQWPLRDVLLSDKDSRASCLDQIALDRLPTFNARDGVRP